MTNYIPSRKILRKMGLVKDQEGIMRRFIRESGNWSSHLTHTKEFIVKNLIDKKPASVAILGSGWLLDIPISYLLKHCKEIFLYDIIHPSPIINRYKKEKRINFIESDLTGGLIEVAYKLRSRKVPGDVRIEDYFQPGIKELPFETEFIVSVNILNQLDILIIDYLKKYVKPKSAQIQKIRSQIQEGHLKLLSEKKSCLITDYEELSIDDKNRVIKTKPLLYVEIPENQIEQRWIWKFDNYNTYHSDYITHFNVLAAKF